MAQNKDEYRAFALRIAQRDDPRTLMWIGGIVLAFAGVLLLGTAMVVAGMVLRRPQTPAQVVPWVFASAITVFVFWLLYIYVGDPIEPNLTYVLVATTAYGPFTFAWRPFIVAGAVMLVAVTYAMSLVDQANVIDWSIGIMASLAVGAVLLSLRLRLLNELADAEQANRLLSTSDELTRLLNRRGLEEHATRLWADATRRGEQVSIWFLDVRGLKTANDGLGHEFGDLVLQDVAQAIQANVRGGDLVARWGGDEFVIVGRGASISADSLSERLTEHLTTHSRTLGDGWSGDVTVGLAHAPALDCAFRDLLQRADDDMYLRRLPR